MLTAALHVAHPMYTSPVEGAYLVTLQAVWHMPLRGWFVSLIVSLIVSLCRLAVQTALLGRIAEPFDTAKGLVRWQEAHRRKLQQCESVLVGVVYWFQTCYVLPCMAS